MILTTVFCTIAVVALLEILISYFIFWLIGVEEKANKISLSKTADNSLIDELFVKELIFELEEASKSGARQLVYYGGYDNEYELQLNVEYVQNRLNATFSDITGFHIDKADLDGGEIEVKFTITWE